MTGDTWRQAQNYRHVEEPTWVWEVTEGLQETHLR